MTIEAERQALASELASLLGVEVTEVDRAIIVEYERHIPAARSLVSTLASVAWLAALLRTMPEIGREAWLSTRSSDGRSQLERLLAGEVTSVLADLADHLAGPYDVSFDGNWPREVARRRLRGKMPPLARVGDMVKGGDGEGNRVDIRVVEAEDGTLTGDVLYETWRDSPYVDIWVATYQRLAEQYPDEVRWTGGR